MSTASNDAPVWLITGCSTGFGREIVAAVIARGWRPVVTARDPASVSDLVERAEGRAIVIVSRLNVSNA